MKDLNIGLLSPIVLLLNYCITTNINQHPILEKSPPHIQWSLQEQEKTKENPLSQPYITDNENQFFEELSKQDPNLEDCKNCSPLNHPPGYNENFYEQNKQSTSQEVVVMIRPETSESNSTQNNQQNFHVEEGIASWYGKDFDGRLTASGEVFDSRKLTAAHPRLPLGTIVSVKNLENQKEVILRINDRGPFVKNRIIDVSEYAAEVLDFKFKGITKVQIKVLKLGNLTEKYEGTTAFFFKRAEGETGGSQFVYDEMIQSKKEQILKQVKDIREFKSYSVQIGSFTDIKNVIRLKEEIEKKIPYPVTILKKENEYQIRIGSFSERYPAEMLKQKLLEEGYSGFVVAPLL